MNSDDYAFPVISTSLSQRGLTKREVFALLFLHAEFAGAGGRIARGSYPAYVAEAVTIADLLCSELNKVK